MSPSVKSTKLTSIIEIRRDFEQALFSSIKSVFYTPFPQTHGQRLKTQLQTCSGEGVKIGEKSAIQGPSPIILDLSIGRFLDHS